MSLYLLLRDRPSSSIEPRELIRSISHFRPHLGAHFCRKLTCACLVDSLLCYRCWRWYDCQIHIIYIFIAVQTLRPHWTRYKTLVPALWVVTPAERSITYYQWLCNRPLLPFEILLQAHATTALVLRGRSLDAVHSLVLSNSSIIHWSRNRGLLLDVASTTVAWINTSVSSLWKPLRSLAWNHFQIVFCQSRKPQSTKSRTFALEPLDVDVYHFSLSLRIDKLLL